METVSEVASFDRVSEQVVVPGFGVWVGFGVGEPLLGSLEGREVKEGWKEGRRVGEGRR